MITAAKIDAMNQPIGRRDPEWATTGAV